MRILAVIVVILMCRPVIAQDNVFNPVPDNTVSSYISEIEKASASLSSLQCSFTQKKSIAVLQESVISTGTLLFKKENKLCWEYKTPYYYLFALNGDKVYIKNDKTASEFDTKSNALFKEISLLLVNSISGTGLIDTKKFDARFFDNKSMLQVKLTPRDKTFKSFMSTVVLYFEKKSYLVKTIEMIEPSGDTNTIVFSEVKLNQPISDEKFMAR